MAKLEMNNYVEVLNAKKWEANAKGWLYIEVNAKELNEEVEAEVKNLTPACKAMLDVMLEGDYFVVEPKSRSKVAGALTVRYYCDNLSPERRKYSEVNA